MAVMAEEGKKEERVALKGSAAAAATLERLQRKGILPVKEPEPPQPPGEASEEYDPSQKKWPTEDAQKQALRELPPYSSEATIPSDVKRELTEEARKLNTMAMAGEASTEAEKVKQTPKEPEHPFSAVEESRRQAMENAPWAERVMGAKKTGSPAGEKPKEGPQETVEEPAKLPIASENPSEKAAPWILEQQPRMVEGTRRAAVGQTEKMTEEGTKLPSEKLFERRQFNQPQAKPPVEAQSPQPLPSQPETPRGGGLGGFFSSLLRRK